MKINRADLPPVIYFYIQMTRYLRIKHEEDSYRYFLKNIKIKLFVINKITYEKLFISIDFFLLLNSVFGYYSLKINRNDRISNKY